jgi:hypothetical protein
VKAASIRHECPLPQGPSNDGAAPHGLTTANVVTLPKIERNGVKSAGFVGVKVMLQGWVVVAIALAYIGFLFLVASYGDRTRVARPT